MNGTVILTVLLVVGSGEAKTIVTGKAPSVHPVLGGFALGLFLFVFAAINAPLAQKFCYLFIAYALIANGGAVVSAINKGKTS